MNKEKVRDAIAYVLGFKPVKTARCRVFVIITHTILWGIFLTLPLFIYRIEILDFHFFYRELINKSFLIVLFYLNYFFLLPRFFQRRKLFNYFFSILGALIFLCLQQMAVELYFLHRIRNSPRGMLVTRNRQFFTARIDNDTSMATRFPISFAAPPATKDQLFFMGDQASFGVTTDLKPPMPFRDRLSVFGFHIPRMILPIILMDALTSGILVLLISSFIKLANSLIISEKQKKQLENERLNAELNFLKLQISPHFLFNTLNSIYSQAHFKSEQTEYSILKFSQIMRYVLYESTAEKILLSKDLEYISNYIHLQKIRVSKNVSIQYQVTGEAGRLLIAPLLLITFIENAFKHGISYSTPSEINIAIEMLNNTLTMQVGNVRHISDNQEPGGVGLLNARRRLDVLYPGRYLLDVVENDLLYIVNLKIELDYET